VNVTTNALATRVHHLVDAFALIGRTRMAGVPVLNAALHVQAVGFAAQKHAGDEEGGALGVLVTPWFMNLIWLAAPHAATPPVGDATLRVIGGEALEFIAAQDDATGPYELCSLYSPMFEFHDQATACATAEAVLDALRQPPTLPAPPAAPREQAPARRAFLFGRSSATTA
jgi:[NiFe] hydrogenase assembly HybE family chaperone